ncbi:MAG: hypothetical protein ACXVDW_10055 [Bacteroidia bacterium]
MGTKEIASILILSCMLSFFTSSAQDYYDGAHPRVKPIKDEQPSDTKGFSISVSLGAAVPSKSFSSTNIKNSFWDFNSADSVKLQGFAKTGVNFNITTSYIFSSGIGIMSMIGTSTNPFDISTFSTTVGVPFTSTDEYRTKEYLIGPCISFSQGPKFKFEANAMIGLVTANYPAVAYAVVDTTETIAFNPGKGFGYSLGGSVKYSITKKIAISINLAYTQAKITYPGWKDTYTAPGYYPYVIPHDNDKATMPIGILKITTGIVFRFR